MTQSAGRGRLGRVWQSPPGNLYASTLVRLRPTDPPAASLAFVAAVALEEVVRAYASWGLKGDADPILLKWPNDLLIGGAKLSGILLEGAGEAVIIGVGLNLAHHPEGLERPVTSLAAQGLEAPDPALVLEDLAAAFQRWLERWRNEGLAPIRAAWLARAHARGTALTANLPDGESIDGLFDGLDPDGALILRLADGGRRVIHAGDVFLI